MRVAVALPSLPASAPERRSIDAALAHLGAAGHDVEGFVEHDRIHDEAPFPLAHYLRMPERHAAAPFDVALYPLGRDASPYQSVWATMHRFPGVVWFVDPGVHQLSVGGIALLGDWAGYRRVMDEAYGEAGAAVAHTVAHNWGAGALYRRYDLVCAAAAQQHAVLAAWPALARRIGERLEGRPVGVVPLGLDRGRSDTDSEPGADRPRRVAILTVNDSYATTAVRVAAALLDLEDGPAVSICLSEPIYKAEGRRAAEHHGILDLIDWQLTSAPDELAAAAAGHDVLVWLAEELQGGHRMLLLRGMLAGKPTLVPRTALYDDLPEGAVARVDLGRAAAPGVAAVVQALRADGELRRALAAAGREFAAGCPDDARAGRELAGALEKAAQGRTLHETPLADDTRDLVATAMLQAGMPAGTSPEVERLIGDLLRSHLEKG